MMARPIATFTTVLFLTGCAATRTSVPDASRLGEVAARTIEPESAVMYPQSKAGEAYYGPYASQANISPQYPARLLAQKLPPVKVMIRLVVDEGGNVAETMALDSVSGEDPAFFTSVQAAVRTWQFTPLIKLGRGPGTTSITFHDRKETFDGNATALPFHQDYEFTFTQRDGKGMVSTSNDHSHP